MFYVIFEFLEEKHFDLIVDSDATITLLPHVVRILLSLLKPSEGKNFNVKGIVVTQMIPQLIQKTKGIKSEGMTQIIFDLMAECSKVEWKTPEERTKNLLFILKEQEKL